MFIWCIKLGNDGNHGYLTLLCFSDLRHKVAALPAITQRSQSGETVLCPSPPLGTSRAAGDRKQSGFREHRLRPGLTSLKTSLPDIKGVGRFSETFKASEVPDLKRQQFQKLPRINVPCQTLPALIPHPPSTRRYSDNNTLLGESVR